MTICAYRHAELFGAVEGQKMRLNAIGRIVSEEWQRSAEVRSYVELDSFVVMPNHIHGILLILNEDLAAERNEKYLQAKSLGAIIGRFKGKVTRRVRDLHGCQQLQVWQRNYHDHIIRNERSLRDIQEYIATNPARWMQDRYCDLSRSKY